MSSDAEYMSRAIRLAMQGRGRVEPNPMVGCAIVKEGRVIGEGCHRQYGGPHAEPNALAACTESPRGATAYVTLEPCCHTNKQTPPCVPRLIKAGIGRVVLGAVDPNPDVFGKGVAQLRDAGIEVATGVLETECEQLAAPFFLGVKRGRPYVTLKWAETANGMVAGAGGRRLQITNDHSSRLVHRLRSHSDAILVGINTVLADDPMLTARGVDPVRPLTRIVLDGDLRIPLGSRLVLSAGDVPVQVWCHAVHAHSPRAAQLSARGVYIGELDAGPDAKMSLEELLFRAQDGVRGAKHLLVEPGPTLAASFFDRGPVDRLWVFRSPLRMDNATSIPAAMVPAHFIRTATAEIQGDTLSEYLNPDSPAFFAPVRSVDFPTGK